MKITFLVPRDGRQPIGGFRIVYQYANSLAAKGHRVRVVHAAFVSSGPVGPLRFMRRHVAEYLFRAATGRWKPDPWFDVDPRVTLAWIPFLAPIFVPDSDVIVATWWRTAEMLAAWPGNKGRKFYLIQHLETWAGPEARVMATWRLPLRKIVIARWLQDIAGELGEDACYIPNGLDFRHFAIDTPPRQRSGTHLAMLYHDDAWKGSGDGLEALTQARHAVPQLTAELFGVGPPPPSLPDWIRYHRNPPQAELRRIYNRAAIFVSPSWAEGWSLPPAESLMCGCALACTDIGGHREYARHGETALLSPAKQPAKLAQDILRLIRDENLRLELARRGHEFVQQFTRERAADAFETLIRSASTPKQAHSSTP